MRCVAMPGCNGLVAAALCPRAAKRLIHPMLSRLIHGKRVHTTAGFSDEDLDAFIDSRALEYATKLEDAFVERALKLGVESGMVLDVGTRVGLIPLKILWQ